MGAAALILGIASIIGTLISVHSNNMNNRFIDETNEENRDFQEKTNLQNHQWSLESAQWEYEHDKPQRQYSDLVSAGLTPAAAAQSVSGANVSYSPATAVAPQNMPKSTDILNDGLQNVISNIGNYSNMALADASAAKTRVETQVISETSIKKANAEIDKILSDTLKSYSDVDVNVSQIENIESNTDLTNEKIETEKVNRRGIELSNQEKEIQLEFTRKTLEMSIQKTEAEIKVLSEQTAKLKEEINGLKFENAYKDWVNSYIDTYGVSPDQGWQDMFYKAVADGKADPLLDSFTESLRQIFSPHSDEWRQEKSAYYREAREELKKSKRERGLEHGYYDSIYGNVYIP